jgi:hypothetical protein
MQNMHQNTTKYPLFITHFPKKDTYNIYNITYSYQSAVLQIVNLITKDKSRTNNI